MNKQVDLRDGDPVDPGVATPLVSWPFFQLEFEKCIKCLQCVRICDEVQHRAVYTVDASGYPALVSGTNDFRDTQCNNCGQCVGACPTGALKDLSDTGRLPKNLREKTTTTCCYCGVGCAIEIETENGEMVAVNPSFVSEANTGNLCVKGRFGMDYLHHADRLTTPLIRRNGKDSPLEPASWAEAIEFTARRLNEVKAEHGAQSLAGLTSARATNEENFVFQKMIRCAFGTNNIDHCARLCHMASAVAFKKAVGSSAPSASTPDVGLASAFIVCGSNTTVTHPVISGQVMKAKYENGAKVVVIDPRRIEMVDHADVWLRARGGTNVAVLNGLAHIIVREGLTNPEFIAARTEGWDDYVRTLDKYTPAYVEEVSGVPADRLQEAALIYANADRGMTLWGMGITQHLTGVDGALAMANLSLMTGHLGKPGTGFIPLRGQSNVQGCSDMQGQHNNLPGYHDIKNPEHRAKFEAAWGVPMPEDEFHSVVRMELGALSGDIKAMYVMGENPMGSSPDIAEVEEGFRKLDFLVVQDLFLSETAALADVVFPAASFAEKDGTFTNTERRVQLLRKAMEPPGEARPDWQIICDVATAMGYVMSYDSTAEIMEEIASLVPSYAGIRHERLEGNGLQWPCFDTDHPGTRYLYEVDFPTPSGRAVFNVVHQDETSDDITDDQYPLNLNTGRLLEHYHTGTQSRRSRGLDHMHPEGQVEVHPEDARRLGLESGCMGRIATKHGSVEVKVVVTDRTQEGAIFYPFHFAEAPANRLTGSKMDQASDTPAFKRTAARIDRVN
ncbi:formate dehydrogenase subunit alpha [Alisedimentitalea sp. MJ-SS2]|uniref:formate dehydrogenase subunit alpha n=1 Tax=Aliisedimentitalea sp. MJ-SS2 TaxID=3049795 RepID=UPI002907FFAB|nr:formate dehydrogenase subunit alpha [Alisedimentitalea sp. MJ-SS2]MDU8928205.1 formate dehydrogenase subunit alpha [Alisedimentitalea sp. MJ-SS2]